MKIAFVHHTNVTQMNVGMTYIMTVAAQNHQVYLYDIVNRVKHFGVYLQAQITKDEPDYICFSVNSFSMQSALFWAQKCRDIRPTCKTIFGGIHPTLFPEETLKYPIVDYICIGEGETSIKQFLDNPQGNTNNNIINSTKQIPIKNQTKRLLVEDLDSLPFLCWDFWDLDHYLQFSGIFGDAFKIVGSRGCPYNCHFCSSSTLNTLYQCNYYRHRSPHNILSEIEYQYNKYKATGFKYVAFDDPCFYPNIENLHAFTQEYTHSSVAHIPWICKSHPAHITPQWIEECRKGGCLHISLGIESFDSVIRNKYLNKNVSDQHIVDILSTLNDVNMLYSIYLIIATPFDSLKSVFKNISSMMSTKAMKIYLSYFTPLPKTPLWKWAQNNKKAHASPRPYSSPKQFTSIKLFCLSLISYPLYTFIKYFYFCRKAFALNGWRLFSLMIQYLTNHNNIRRASLCDFRTIQHEFYTISICQKEFSQRMHSQ